MKKLICIIVLMAGIQGVSLGQCTTGGAAWLNGPNDGIMRDTGIIAGSVLVYARTVGTMVSGRPLYRIGSSTWKGLNYAALEVWRAYNFPGTNYTSFKLQTPLDSNRMHLRVDNIRGDGFNAENQLIKGFNNGVPVGIDFKDPVNGATISGGNTIVGWPGTTSAVQSAMRAFFRGPVDSIVVQEAAWSDWIIAQLMIQCDYLLPMNLGEWTALTSGSGISVKWSAASEPTTLTSYILERSTDGRNFSAIAQVEARGAGYRYQYDDLHPAIPVNYYRLRFVYLDGRMEYSTVLLVKSESNGSPKALAYPNPARTSFTLSLTNAPAGGSIFDEGGRFLGKVDKKAGAQTIDCYHWPPGIYHVRLLWQNGETQTVKILKQ